MNLKMVLSDKKMGISQVNDVILVNVNLRGSIGMIKCHTHASSVWWNVSNVT